MRALVLSGGGSRGAFQIGVLKRWMGDLEQDYDIMCGVSVGALNVAGLVHTPFGQPRKAIEWMEQFWLTKVTGTDAIYKRWFPFGRLHSLWKRSVYDSSPLINLVKDNIDLSKVSSCGRRVAVGAVCLDTGEYEFGTEKDQNFVDWVLASSSFPVFLTPIEINGKLYSDGGLVNITPLGQAIRMGADEIDVVMCSDPFAKDEWSSTGKMAVPDQILRTVGIMSDRIAQFDIEEIGLKNDLADISDKYKKIKVRVVVPSRPLNVDSLTFNPEDTRRLIQQGYEDSNNITVYE